MRGLDGLHGFNGLRGLLLERTGKADGMFRIKDIAAGFEVTYSTAQRWTKAGGFPRPVWAGGRPSWLADDLVMWMMREEKG